MKPKCMLCSKLFAPKRFELGYRVCMKCGDTAAVKDRQNWCIAPISNKAAYTLITDYTLLKQINPKRTT